MKILLNSILNNMNCKIKSFFGKTKDFQLNINAFIFLYSLLTIILFNFNFFKSVFDINRAFLIISFFVILLIYNTLFTILFQRKITKAIAIFLLLGNAGTLYFINTYNVIIDKVMLLNVKETNLNETLELLNFVWFKYILFLGVIPSFIVFKTKIKYQKLKKEILYRILSIFISLFIIFIFVFLNFKTTSSFVRQNKRLKHILLPFNYLDAGFGLIKNNIKQKEYNFQDITQDVVYEHKTKNNKKNLVIFVVGEASRNKNWSLSGYEKNTNEYLKGQNLIYYNNFFSCGTSTAISVPCMFSNLSRSNFDIEKRDIYSNLLDFLKKADFDVLWRENNSDCKGVCKRVKEDNFIKDKNNKNFCNNKECFDEILIQDLQEKIDNIVSKNNFIVLHQKGSHGPAYYLRYPEKFKKYQPTCNSEYFNKCKDEEIINSYDNTINYTSFILNRSIEILKENKDKFNTVLIYVSDHGQSLGEKGIYLHGTPYIFSPEEQRHIPFFLWFSEDFKEEFNIDETCLKNKSNQELSHDNIFHSILGLFEIKTKYYDEKLDIFNKCKK